MDTWSPAGAGDEGRVVRGNAKAADQLAAVLAPVAARALVARPAPFFFPACRRRGRRPKMKDPTAAARASASLVRSSEIDGA